MSVFSNKGYRILSLSLWGTGAYLQPFKPTSSSLFLTLRSLLLVRELPPVRFLFELPFSTLTYPLVCLQRVTLRCIVNYRLTSKQTKLTRKKHPCLGSWEFVHLVAAAVHANLNSTRHRYVLLCTGDVKHSIKLYSAFYAVPLPVIALGRAINYAPSWEARAPQNSDIMSMYLYCINWAGT